MTRSVPSHENPDLLARAVARGPNCPPVERLAEAVLGEIHSDERQALEAHAAGCPACGSEWALAHAFALAGVGEEAGVERVLASLSAKPAGGGRLLDFRSSPRRAARGSATSAWQRGAVAALLVAGLGLGYLTVRGGVPPDPGVPPGDDVVRATGFALGAPAGALEAAPSRLEFEALPGAQRYRVELLDVGGNAFWTALVLAPPGELDGEARAQLRPRARYGWRVVALGAGGEEIARSPVQEFTLP